MLDRMTIPEVSISHRDKMHSAWGWKGDSASSKTPPVENIMAQVFGNKSPEPGSNSAANSINV